MVLSIPRSAIGRSHGQSEEIVSTASANDCLAYASVDVLIRRNSRVMLLALMGCVEGLVRVSQSL